MISGLRRLSLNLSKYDPVKIIEDILGEHLGYIEDLQRSQLYAGLDGSGVPFRLKYSQDPYFKKPGAGLRYAKWKRKREFTVSTGDSKPLVSAYKKPLFPRRDEDTPNLIVNGNLLYNKVIAQAEGRSLILTAQSPIFGKLTQKYGEVLGLSPLAINNIIESFLLEELQQRTYNQLTQ